MHGMRSQRISQFYLHTLCSSANGITILGFAFAATTRCSAIAERPRCDLPAHVMSVFPEVQPP